MVLNIFAMFVFDEFTCTDSQLPQSFYSIFFAKYVNFWFAMMINWYFLMRFTPEERAIVLEMAKNCLSKHNLKLIFFPLVTFFSIESGLK